MQTRRLWVGSVPVRATVIACGLTLLMLTTASSSIVAAQNDGIPTASYCDIRKSEKSYDGRPVRLQVLWRFDRKQKLSYIHSEPQCVGRTTLDFGGVCPGMESLPIDFDRAFEADVVMTGLFYYRFPGKLQDVGGDGTSFLTSCIESFKERSRTPEANQPR